MVPSVVDLPHGVCELGREKACSIKSNFEMSCPDVTFCLGAEAVAPLALLAVEGTGAEGALVPGGSSLW